ncbi:MAG TPA: guanosine-3',5'-bis(diphosphate) 3'-diphosphatase, partial [Gammaproteobacteria bacterium]|nr:guanosine-3',5'-bis(diphosphate) 3'-diphosphatase [Gammaproteobacteria bacterium]
MTTQPTHSERTAPRPPRKAAPAPEPPASAPDARFHIGDLCALLESYLSAPEVADVYRAYLFSAEAHEGQHRRSGEPYIFHPIEVARVLALMHLDSKSISAAILHDVIEDTAHNKDKIAELFGKDVAELVDGVSKIDQIEFRTEEDEQAENFRKMLL